VEAVERVARLADEREARLVAVTGGVAAGKSTFAAALVSALARPGVVVASDGFLFPNAELAARGLSARKGFPDSFDRDALASFLDAVRAGDPAAAAPCYSHRTYDVVPGDRVAVGDAEVVVVEGLHLASAELGVRDRFDLVVHLDAADDDLRGWYLARFRALRAAAESDPTAFLHPYVALGGEALDAMALDVWDAVNLAVLHEHVRADEDAADVVVRFGPDHGVDSIVVRS